MQEEKSDKKRIKCAFVDFWTGYKPETHYIYQSLVEKYDIEIDDDKPDFLFYSCFGYQHLRYRNVIKVFYTGENTYPNYNLCDYSLSFVRDSMGGRNLYFPTATRYNHQTLPPVTKEFAKRRFCNFIYSQDTMGGGAIFRKQVCQELMNYRQVDCPGKVLHNMDAPELSIRTSNNWHGSKIDFLSKYKFTMAFENSDRDGYMTEKLLDPLLAGSVPIYWGSEGNVAPFEKDCMICAYDYPDMESLLERIREVDQNEEEYLRLCEANPVRTGKLLPYKQQFLEFFDKIYEEGTILKDREILLHFDPSHMLISNPVVNKALKLQEWYNRHQSLKRFIKAMIGKK